MQIEVKGKNLQVTDEMREYAERRFDKITKQVSELATLDLEVADENVPGDPIAAEAVLHLKGTSCGRRRSPRTPSTRSTSSRTTWSARSSAIATSVAPGASRAQRPSSRARARGRSRKRPAPRSNTPIRGALDR